MRASKANPMATTTAPTETRLAARALLELIAELVVRAAIPDAADGRDDVDDRNEASNE